MSTLALGKQILNSSTDGYFQLPSQNAQIQDLCFELNKQVLNMINFTNLEISAKAQKLQNTIETIKDESEEYGNNFKNTQYNSIVLPPVSNSIGNICDYSDVLSSRAFTASVECSNSLNSYNVKGDDLVMNGNNEDISNLTDSYAKNFLPSLPLGVALGIVTSAFHIAMDYIFAPLMFLVIADLFFNGIADFFTKKREGRMFKKIYQYFAIFFFLTWLIILELILIRYNLTPMLDTALNNHVLVYGFFVATILMSARNIRDSLVRLELPMSPFAKIVCIGLKKFSPDAIEYLNKYLDKNKDKSKDKVNENDTDD